MGDGVSVADVDGATQPVVLVEGREEVAAAS